MKTTIEVRRNNGQCGYGRWMDAADQCVPAWVIKYSIDAMIDDGLDAGQVERGGSKWDWRIVPSNTPETENIYA